TTAEYKPLTFWNQFRLGGTFFTNATLARNIRIVYAFDLSNPSMQVKDKEISALAHEGKVTFGVLDNESRSIRSAPSGTTNISDLKKLFPNDKIVVLSPNDSLLGQTPSGTFFTTIRD